MPWRGITILGRNKPSVLEYIPSRVIFPIAVSNKIAAFDLVNTLIWSDRGHRVPQGDMWVWRDEGLPALLAKLIKDQWTVVIFSNYVSTGLDEFKARLEQIFKDVGSDFFVFASLVSDEYKKPNTGMWKLFESYLGNQVPDPDSFYVGDRAGDLTQEDPMFWVGGDDKEFANNIGLNFYLPIDLPLPVPTYQLAIPSIIIMVGQPGSGKSTWAKWFADQNNFELISGDIIKSPAKRVQLAADYLDQQRGVIIDATSPTLNSRRPYIELAENKGIPAIIAWATRPGWYYNKERAKPVPDVALYTYSKNFERPTTAEGADIIRVN